MKIDRIYQDEDNLWYFTVRGNLTKGPFINYHDAEGALSDHVRRCRRSAGASLWPRSLRSRKNHRGDASEPGHS